MSVVVRTVLGAVIGAGIGYTMYRVVGCRTGACPLTANQYVATIIWGALGAVVGAGK